MASLFSRNIQLNGRFGAYFMVDGQKSISSLTIRAAVPEDEQRLVVLNGFVQDLHVAKRPDYFKPSDQAELAEWFQGRLQNPLVRIWIAEDAETPVGFLITVVQDRPENTLCRSRRWCEIDQVAVAPDFRRKGVASALIQKALTMAEADGLAEVELCSWSFNAPAQALYRKFGFEPKMLRWEQKSVVR